MIPSLPQIRTWAYENRWFCLIFISSGLLHFISQKHLDRKELGVPETANQSKLSKGSSSTLTDAEDSLTADTYIPAGYSLVPIELTNSDTIEGLVGSLGGYVDLFPVSTNSDPASTPNPSLSLLKNLKMLRAPHNPELYAVLVAQKNVPAFMNLSGTFRAVVLNPQKAKKEQAIAHSLSSQAKPDEDSSEIYYGYGSK